MFQSRNHNLLRDGKPVLIMAGEVHYFRVDRAHWAARLDTMAAAGFNAVSTYIPWLVHEMPDGTFDLTGRTHPENDLGAFIDMAGERGLSFLARPGPYVMAEMKNEGIPYRLFQIPGIQPRGWDNAVPPVPTLDLDNPLFLAEVRTWYAALGTVLAPRMEPVGGPVIMVQLDNEIGMLDWISNTPCLTAHLISAFANWLVVTHGGALLALYPPEVLDPFERIHAVRSPQAWYRTRIRIDLGRFMRERFADYVDTLARYAQESGFGGVPFMVNLHGTSGGFAEFFPIGISQLYLTYANKPGFLSGSDVYLGQPNLRNTAELHMINAMMESMNGVDQAVTSMEFEAGTGDYGSGLEFAQDPSTVDLKTRLCVAQNHKLFNFYLLAGGRNRALDTPVADGNSRIATTGERHGAAAPISPEGERTRTWEPTRAAVEAVRANECWLAAAVEERDDVALGWCPDYYLTEYRYQGGSDASRDQELIGDLEGNRSGGPRHALPRMMLYSGYRYGAVNLQESGWWRRSGAPRVIAFAAAGQMDPSWQQDLLDFVSNGGGLFLYGNIPTQDMFGMPCTILTEAMGISHRAVFFDSHGIWLSARPMGWAAADQEHPTRAEVRCGFAHTWDAGANDVLAELTLNGEAIAIDARVGRGRIITLTSDYPTDLDFAAEALARLGATRGLVHNSTLPGIVMTTTHDGRSRLLHVINITGYSDQVTIKLDGVALLGGNRLEVSPYAGMMLPIGADLELGETRVRIDWSTAELAGVTNLPDGSGARLVLRLTQTTDRIRFAGPVAVDAGERTDVRVAHEGGTLITVFRNSVPGSLVARDLAARTRNETDLLELVIRPISNQ